MKKTSADRAMLKAFRTKCDAFLPHMQTSKAKKGMAAAFNASPVELGRAAIKVSCKYR